MPDSSEAHCQASLNTARNPNGEPYPVFASEKSRTEASDKTGSDPLIQRVQKMEEVSQVQFIDKVMDIPVISERQMSMMNQVQKTVEVPQIPVRRQDWWMRPVAVTQPSVPGEAERESCSKKRKSAFESDEMVDEASDLDAFGLVQGEKCTRVADESEAQVPEDELVPVAPNMGGRWLTPPGHVEPGMG